MLERNENERHGILLIDEMATRESIHVKSKNLTFTSLVDFGNNDERLKILKTKQTMDSYSCISH